MATDPRQPPKALLWAVATLGAVCLAAAAWFAREQTLDIRREVAANLLSIADFKVRLVMDWWGERTQDARVVGEDEPLALLAGKAAAGGIEAAVLKKRLESVRKHYEYAALLVFDAQGRLTVWTGDARPPEPLGADQAMEAIRRKGLVVDDVRRHADGHNYATLFIPLAVLKSGPPGVAALRIDLTKRLFPELEAWPVRSETAEVLLVRQEGDGLVCLNPRQQPAGSSAPQRLPARALDVSAIRDRTGITEFLDHRGIRVLSAVRKVEGTPWLLVVKIDTGEALAGARSRATVWLVATAMAAIAVFSLGLLIWRSRETHHYRRLYEAQAERQALVGHFEYLHRYANDMILLVDDEGTIVEANERAAAAYGWPREELLGKKIRDLRHPSTLEEFEKQWSRAATPEGIVFETRHVRRDGSVFPVEVSSRSIEIEGKRYRQSILRDIAERKQHEMALARIEANLEMAQQIASLGSWELDFGAPPDFEGCNYWWSDEVFRIFGVDRTTYIPSWENFLACIHPEDRERVRSESRKAIESGLRYKAEHRVIRPDGSVRYVREQAEVLRDGVGEPLKMIGTVHDITEIKRLEEQLLESRRLESIGLLAGGVAHDFNNLLTVINGYCELVLNSMPRSDPNRAALLEVAKAGERAAALTRQLLAFSRKQVLVPRVFDLNAAVKDMESFLRRLAGEKIALELRLNAHPGEVLADLSQVQQVILNLVVNARDAQPQGGSIDVGTSSVRITGKPPGDTEEPEPGEYVVLTIKDAGEGMPAEVRNRIFEPFFTTKPQGAGTGLGLSMVYGIVRQSRGWVEVDSTPGTGSTFRVYLPRAEIQTVEQEGGRSPQDHRGSGRILVVEDHDEVRRLAAEALRQSGYEVIEARNAAEAVEICTGAGQPLDLLLADVVMPGMNGRDLAMELRALRPGLRVLLMSGYAQNVVALKEVEAAGLGFIQKPFSPAELAMAVAKAIRER